MKHFALKSLTKTLIWIGIPSAIFTIIYFKWVGKDLVDYSQVLTALVAIISLFLFSKSILIKNNNTRSISFLKSTKMKWQGYFQN